ncbi:hypothetical protein ASPBRDRAFT_38600 [Aspergillus brasiliensis CBS 101740]|uniref:Uncharacterized protein n=1 Tax=Aspergillus brasiliensis (strain CBS 101740 / IMI 381727 / IBT 21946) TaxID=767769 RepID=A0A1L9UX48_ASPBC|nr:hypothetical protein ASPBRDRAFT_38600 [Aspergillus brasiliensis CBS 101740]
MAPGFLPKVPRWAKVWQQREARRSKLVVVLVTTLYRSLWSDLQAMIPCSHPQSEWLVSMSYGAIGEEAWVSLARTHAKRPGMFV